MLYWYKTQFFKSITISSMTGVAWEPGIVLNKNMKIDKNATIILELITQKDATWC